jgi:hypothetical protein
MAREECFTITINDSFCTWEFKLKPKHWNNLSINDLMEVLENHFDTKAFDDKLIKEKLKTNK